MLERVCERWRGCVCERWRGFLILVFLVTSGWSWAQLNSPKMWIIASVSMGCCYLVSKPYSTLCDPVDCSPLGSSVHGIFLARILEWVAISFSRVFPTQGSNLYLPHCQVNSLPLSHQESPQWTVTKIN